MRNRVPILFFAITAGLVVGVVAITYATATYDYKLGEFLPIKNGRSPDQKLLIVSGETNAAEFGVFLMNGKTKRVIGPLEEVAITLDSDPDAYHAHWSPDSKHVGITSRADRNWSINAIYRIENRRAYPVETPELLCHAATYFCQLTKDLGGALKPDEIDHDDGVSIPWKARQNSTYSEIVKWISPTRFVIKEKSQFQIRDRDPSASLGKFAEVEKLKPEGNEPGDVYHVRFSAEGECDLLPGDKSRVVSTRPIEDKNKTDFLARAASIFPPETFPRPR